MTYAVVYSSITGNTKRLAEAVREVLPANQCLYFGPPDMEVQKEDMLFVGFWTDKGGCDETVAAFLRSLEHKKVALFGTAGFGGEQSYYNEIASRVGALLPRNCTMEGSFLCQGKMPGSVKRRYQAILADKPEDEKLRSMIENFDRAASHPDAEDIDACRSFVRDMINEEI